MRTVFEWDGKYDIQPFQVGGTATTKTLTTQNTDVYVKDNAYSLRFYANDAAAGKTCLTNMSLALPVETGIRISCDYITSLANSAWDRFTFNIKRFDGTNHSQLGLNILSTSDTANKIQAGNDANGFTDIVGLSLVEILNVWQHFELIADFNATDDEPTYSFLELNETQVTTFPGNGYNAASAVPEKFYVELVWQPDDGASAYMFVNNLKVEVF